MIVGATASGKGVRWASVCAIERIGVVNDDLIQTLTSLIDDEDQLIGHIAIRTLGRFGPRAKTAVPRLIEMLKRKDFLRHTAAQALGNIGPDAKDAVPILLKHLRPGGRAFRTTYAEALRKIDPTMGR